MTQNPTNFHFDPILPPLQPAKHRDLPAPPGDAKPVQTADGLYSLAMPTYSLHTFEPTTAAVAAALGETGGRPAHDRS